MTRHPLSALRLLVSTLAAASERRPLLGRGLILGSWSTTLLACLGVLLPKCPLCLAVYLCWFGFSAGTAGFLSQLSWPLCVAALLLSSLGTLLFALHRARRRARCEGKRPAAQPCACPNARTSREQS